MDTPYQPTGSGTWIWRKPLTRNVVDCAQFAKFEARPTFGETQGAKLALMFPDPRDLTIAALRESLEAAHRFGIANHERAARVDARIAELEARDEQIEMLEAALKAIYAISDNWDRSCVDRLEAIRNTVRAALMPAPEGDMTITVEELPA